MAAQSKRLSFAEFREIVAEQLKVDSERITRDASFINDLFADSIRMVELMLRLEELGIPIPTEAIWQMQTVGDAYDYYLENLPGLPGLAPGTVPSEK